MSSSAEQLRLPGLKRERIYSSNACLDTGIILEDGACVSAVAKHSKITTPEGTFCCNLSVASIKKACERFTETDDNHRFVLILCQRRECRQFQRFHLVCCSCHEVFLFGQEQRRGNTFHIPKHSQCIAEGQAHVEEEEHLHNDENVEENQSDANEQASDLSTEAGVDQQSWSGQGPDRFFSNWNAPVTRKRDDSGFQVEIKCQAEDTAIVEEIGDRLLHLAKDTIQRIHKQCGRLVILIPTSRTAEHEQASQQLRKWLKAIDFVGENAAWTALQDSDMDIRIQPMDQPDSAKGRGAVLLYPATKSAERLGKHHVEALVQTIGQLRNFSTLSAVSQQQHLPFQTYALFDRQAHPGLPPVQYKAEQPASDRTWESFEISLSVSYQQTDAPLHLVTEEHLRQVHQHFLVGLSGNGLEAWVQKLSKVTITVEKG